MNRTCHIFCLVLCCYAATAQRKIDYTKIFQVSLTPAIGTNGMHPGGYINYFSFNLTSGYSMANYIFEIGLISNLNVNETKGLQISGIANLTGANAFAGMQQKEKDEKIKRGFEANLTGFQIAGVSNVVLNNVFGGQISGVTNVAKGALQGFQLSGISNVVYKYSFGVQAATVFNISYQSMDGYNSRGYQTLLQGGCMEFKLPL